MHVCVLMCVCVCMRERAGDDPLLPLPFETGESVELQCVAVCCSVLQCVAVCCSVLQCVAVCCSVLQTHANATVQTLSRPLALLHACVRRRPHSAFLCRTLFFFLPSLYSL